jgi:hypothetical protein
MEPRRPICQWNVAHRYRDAMIRLMAVMYVIKVATIDSASPQRHPVTDQSYLGRVREGEVCRYMASFPTSAPEFDGRLRGLGGRRGQTSGGQAHCYLVRTRRDRSGESTLVHLAPTYGCAMFCRSADIPDAVCPLPCGLRRKPAGAALVGTYALSRPLRHPFIPTQRTTAHTLTLTAQPICRKRKR